MNNRKFYIRSLLRAHLTELDLPSVAWENQVFEPEDGKTFIRETMLPANETLTANNERSAIGIYQIDVFAPMNSSISAAENLADEIKEHFYPGQAIGSLSIERSAVLNGSRNGAWYHIIVQIDYRSHQINTVLT